MSGGRIGLVLGAGGVSGHGFHSGVLSALAEVTGWDPRGADTIVGTSAGSVVASMLRAGLGAGDLLARATGEPLSASGAALLSRLGQAQPRAPGWPDSRPPPSGRSLGALLAAAPRPWSARPGAVMAALLPPGRRPTTPISLLVANLLPSGWPAAPLWVCAVGLGDGHRVVFGSPDGPAADVGRAVAASCAIPGYYQPVPIGGKDYVDGGCHSPTNADLLARVGLDLVVVSSPMSMTGGWSGLGPDFPARRAAGLMLASEVGRLRRQGISALVIQPTRDNRDAMGLNAMDPDRRAPSARSAQESVRAWLTTADGRDQDVSASVATLRQAGAG